MRLVAVLQNGDLKKQIHERQSRIAALNEKQVRNRSIQLCLVFLLVFTMHYLNIRKVSALAEKIPTAENITSIFLSVK